jgi:hypothetical protein
MVFERLGRLMKKRIISVFLTVVLVIFILPLTASAGTLSNFSKVSGYTAGQFTDVSNQWFAPYVQAAYEYGLMNGTSATAFSPGSNLTIAEAVKLASCLHSIYNNGAANFTAAEPWYQPYVDYAQLNGIISSFANYTAPATRSDFATIFAKSLPDEALTALNTIGDTAIPDVTLGYSYGPAVYKLYRAGILTGSDSAGTFYPNTYITRDSVAAIAVRMADPSYRQTLTLTAPEKEPATVENEPAATVKELTTTEIAAKCSPAVFYIEVSDSSGKVYGSGSGFFIDAGGVAVTAFHVIKGAASAKITTKDGKKYDVAGIYDYNEQNDLALLKINGSGFPILSVGNSDTAATGATIYAVGYPLGIDQTFNTGTITNASHQEDGVNFIMIDASISHGSSGGAILNTSGQVIGVTCASYEDGQNLNLAVPINLIKSLSQTTSTALPVGTVATQSNPSGATIKSSVTSVTVAVGSQTSCVITDSTGNPNYSISYSIVNTSVVSCYWGDWLNSYNCPLNIKGLSAGSTTVAVYLLDENDKVLASTAIDVTVTAGGSSGGSSATVYYTGTNVPDWGAFTGTPLYYKYTAPSGSQGVQYVYRLIDAKASAEVAVDQYLTLLKSNGYSYLYSTTNPDGYTVLTYTNNTWNVYMGMLETEGYVCMGIAILKS